MALKTRHTRTVKQYNTTDNASVQAPKTSQSRYTQLGTVSFRKITGIDTQTPGVTGESVELGAQNGYWAQHRLMGWRVFVVCTGAHKGAWAQVDNTGWPMVNDWQARFGARY